MSTLSDSHSKNAPQISERQSKSNAEAANRFILNHLGLTPRSVDPHRTVTQKDNIFSASELERA